MLSRLTLIAAAAGLAFWAAPVRADGWGEHGRWGWHDHGWGHGDWHRPWGGPCCYHPWVYAAPPPVYYAPPPPAYYGPPPGVTVGLHWP